MAGVRVFLEILKIGIIGIFVMLKVENKGKIDISGIICNSMWPGRTHVSTKINSISNCSEIIYIKKLLQFCPSSLRAAGSKRGSLSQLHSARQPCPILYRNVHWDAFLGKILAKSYVGFPPSRGLGPPPRGNPGSATDVNNVNFVHFEKKTN